MTEIATSSPSHPPTSWTCFLVAVQFLTRVPVTRWLSVGTAGSFHEALRGAVVFFPLVGGMIGLGTSAIVIALSPGLSPLLCALVAIGLEAMITGAFHEDAFADSCDALGGGWSRDQVLEIMKDSRLGTYGALGLMIGVGLRVAAIASLLSSGWLWTVASIVAASTLGRLAIVGMMVTTSPIPDRASQANDLSGAQTWRTLWLSAAMVLPMWAGWFWLSPGLAVCTVTVAIVVLVWLRHKIIVRVGGTTGDLLGCSAYLIQLIVLVGSSWMAGDA